MNWMCVSCSFKTDGSDQLSPQCLSTKNEPLTLLFIFLISSTCKILLLYMISKINLSSHSLKFQERKMKGDIMFGSCNEGWCVNARTQNLISHNDTLTYIVSLTHTYIYIYILYVYVYIYIYTLTHKHRMFHNPAQTVFYKPLYFHPHASHAYWVSFPSLLRSVNFHSECIISSFHILLYRSFSYNLSKIPPAHM